VFRPVTATELEILVNAFGDLSRAVNVNVDANDEINVESGVCTTPTFVFFRSGEWVLEGEVGACSEVLSNKSYEFAT
jgi:hypothetical protein